MVEMQNNNINYMVCFFKRHYWLCFLLLFSIFCKIFTAVRYEINWDEFYYLSFIYKFIVGDSINSFQTFHVHFFSWLRLVSKNEVEQIVFARILMVLLQVVTGYFIFKICRYQFSISASVFAVLAYFSFSYVIRTGASFRADPIATCCLVITLYYILSVRMTIIHSILSGIITAFSFAFTLKSAIYLPTFILIMAINLVYSQERRIDLYRYFFYFLSTSLAFLLFYLYHFTSIGTTDFFKDTGSMVNGADKTFNHNLLFPRKSYLLFSFVMDIGYWLVLLYGIKYLVLSLMKERTNNKEYSLKFIALLILLLSLVFYRNSYPYFYSFMLAPVSVLFAMSWDVFHSQGTNIERKIFSTVVMLFFLLSAAYNGVITPFKRSLDYQHRLIEVVHTVFPSPVSYLDRCSMISSYPQKGFFMSTWGMENYLKRNKAVIKHAVENKEPVFMVLNSPYLNVMSSDGGEANWMLREDVQALKNNYIQHWNELYVAGKQIILTEKDPKMVFKINISGKYTLESDSGVFVDGELIYPLETINLSKGTHSMALSNQSGEFILRWGESLYRPVEINREEPVFTGF
ncbi:hypothetical protein DI392_05995 [Vibrio albus]|uniref:Glycosyltransferase RgtA/B/C/D-like domain-containing protein n=1 Tax=Vibrio albus TaxID=2200953 RepID=A0A2U3BCY9_9VIBR|nr:hypothetical protein [Vibrio albus]PWI34651.1 hypothetical protein DI392_05995 [Vibrio albus]